MTNKKKNYLPSFSNYAFDVQNKNKKDNKFTKFLFYPKYFNDIDQLNLEHEKDLVKLKDYVGKIKNIEKDNFISKQINLKGFLVMIPSIIIVFVLISLFIYFALNHHIFTRAMRFITSISSILIISINVLTLRWLHKKTTIWIKLYLLQQLYWINKSKAQSVVYDYLIINLKNGEYCASIYMLICQHFLKNKSFEIINKNVLYEYALKEIMLFGSSFVLIDKQINPTNELISFLNNSQFYQNDKSLYIYQNQTELKNLVYKWLN